MTAHLRIYRFDAGATFEGALVGAIERMQLGHEGELLDALFVQRSAGSDVLDAVDLAVGRAGGTFASLLDFRLEPGRRHAITERTLAEHPGGVPRSLIEGIAAALEAEEALFAVLHTGPTATALDDAAARSGGRLIAHQPIDARALAQADAELRAAVDSPSTKTL